MSHNRASVSPGRRLGVCVHKITSFVYVGFYLVTAGGCHSVSACEMHNNAMMLQCVPILKANKVYL